MQVDRKESEWEQKEINFQTASMLSSILRTGMINFPPGMKFPELPENLSIATSILFQNHFDKYDEE